MTHVALDADDFADEACGRAVETALDVKHVSVCERGISAELAAAFGHIEHFGLEDLRLAVLLNDPDVGWLTYGCSDVAAPLDAFVLAYEKDLDGAAVAFEYAAANFGEPALFAEAHAHGQVGFQVDGRSLFVSDDDEIPSSTRDVTSPEHYRLVVLDEDVLTDLEFPHAALSDR